ncbi:PEP-CTERM sorting domain-containing protein [Xylophilus rhododendri]|uniref:PEP-CTERM sorting domain-containing protein n=1 Tax=Xylophilus rhododendri TaxID=2697032 RepID=A0A857JEY5_9BURK|nr:PEP-CTERM sorting domain-containing protein [Xylophilus rhododendri]QHJ01246.1 PEP-CTERM sorting domain-containing protein [Xylophilus rhododendri]
MRLRLSTLTKYSFACVHIPHRCQKDFSMLNKLCTACVLAFSLGATHAATTILGDTINVGGYYPDTVTLTDDLGNHTVTPSGVVVSYGGFITFTVAPTSIIVSFSEGGIGAGVSFEGFIFHDVTRPFPASYFLDMAGTTLTPGTFAFATVGSDFQLNFAGTRLEAGDTIKFTLSPVPEPDSAALALAGLAVLVGAARRMRRSRTA